MSNTCLKCGVQHEQSVMGGASGVGAAARAVFSISCVLCYGCGGVFGHFDLLYGQFCPCVTLEEVACAVWGVLSVTCVLGVCYLPLVCVISMCSVLLSLCMFSFPLIFYNFSLWSV